MGNTYSGGAYYDNRAKKTIEKVLNRTKLRTGEDDIKSHTNVKIVDTDNTQYDITQYWKIYNCYKQLPKIYKQMYDKNTFYSTMYNKYKENKNKNAQWGEGGINGNKINEELLMIMDNKFTNGTHLDYGSGGGLTSIEVKERYKIRYCIEVDIEDNRIYKNNSRFIENKDINLIDREIQHNSIDLITALQTFHHNDFNYLPGKYKNFDARINYVIKTLISKLKPGGYLLIKEHDIENIDEVYTVVFKHLLYSLNEFPNKNLTHGDIKQYIDNYHINKRAWYMSYAYLCNIIESFGMQLINARWLFDIKNTNLRIYNALYQKNKR